jgi:hypothetical protein
LDTIRDELEKIRKANGGRLRRADIVAAASHKRHPLHDEFDWNDKTAAHKHRLERAQELITLVVLTVTHRARQITSVMYVRDPRVQTGEQGHVALTQEDLTRDDSRQIVFNEVDRCAACISRARAVAEMLEARCPGIMVQLQKMLEELIKLRDDLAA